jgi:hypothetical protein
VLALPVMNDSFRRYRAVLARPMAGGSSHEPLRWVMSTTTTGAMAARSSQAMPDLPGYLDLLITRFATYGTSDNPGRCRCGHSRPCAEEQHVAELLELIGNACR